MHGHMPTFRVCLASRAKEFLQEENKMIPKKKKHCNSFCSALLCSRVLENLEKQLTESQLEDKLMSDG